MVGGWSRGATIGQGSTEKVSVATTNDSRQVFAVKTVELAHSARLRREHSLLSSLSSTHIVRCLGEDVSFEGCKSFYNLFMEYFPGGTLSDKIKRWGGRIPEEEVRRHTRSVLEGLDYLHGIGIVHCDIKSSNLLMGMDGEVKIGDLGCAVREDGGNGMAELAGTPLFMAPEVVRGESQGCPADVWALGCTVVELVTGRPPWPEVSDTVSAIYRIGFTEEMPGIPGELSDEGKDFLRMCFRRNPWERWTAEQLLKHPFVNEFRALAFDTKPFSVSPKSILDRDLWDSPGVGITRTDSLSSNPSPLEDETVAAAAAGRIRALCSPSARSPAWSCGENWVCVRSNVSESLEIPAVEASEQLENAEISRMSEIDCELVEEGSSVVVGYSGEEDGSYDQLFSSRMSSTSIHSFDHVNACNPFSAFHSLGSENVLNSLFKLELLSLSLSLSLSLTHTHTHYRLCFYALEEFDGF